MENFEQSLIEINKLAKEEMNPELKMKIVKDIAKPYTALLTYYECAIDEVETKLNILNKEYSLNTEQNPIDSIKSRVKSIESIVEKAYRKNIPFTILLRYLSTKWPKDYILVITCYLDLISG